MASNKRKTYGLIIPSKAGQVSNNSALSSTYNVFGNESDEEDSCLVKKPLGSSTVKRQTQLNIEKALQDDPTVYEYDSIYDDLQATKSQAGEKEKSALAKKPRYITGLLKAAEIKKKEDERRKERQVQKEREAEGEMFTDKEKFVTSAYKQKMLEMAEAEEKEKREAALENILDVTKQKDMSGFYRYLYRTSTGNVDTPTKDDTTMQEKLNTSSTPTHTKSSSASSDSSDSKRCCHNSSEDGCQNEIIEFSKPNRPSHGGKFRQHRSDSSSPEPPEKSYKKTPKHEINGNMQDKLGESSKVGHQESRRDTHYRDNHRESRNYRNNHRESRDKREMFKGPFDGSDIRESRVGHRASEQIKKRQRSSSPTDNKSETSSSNTRKRSRERCRSKEMIRRSKSIDKKHKESLSPPAADTTEPSTDTANNIRDNSHKMGVMSEPIDPRCKVYPYHNTAKDITEARKRYLQRKIARHCCLDLKL